MLYEIFIIFMSMFAAIGITDTVTYIFRRICLRRYRGRVHILIVGSEEGARWVASAVRDQIGEPAELMQNSEILNKS